MSSLTQKKCTACHSGSGKLTPDTIKNFIKLIPLWKLNKEHQIERSFKFKDFSQALKFVNQVGDLAEREGHHPDIYLSWGKVKIILWTHAVEGLSENDFIMAAKIDQIN